MRKKLWALIPVVGFTTTALVGCGATGNGTGNTTSKTGAASGTTTIQFAFWGSSSESKAIKQAIAVFEKSHPKIHVTPIYVSQNYDQKLTTMIAGGTAPDVMLISNADLPGYSQSFQQLTIHSQDYSTSQISKQMQVNGKSFAYPFVIKPKVMLVNMDLFKKYHVPLPSQTKAMTPTQFQQDAIRLTHGSGKSKVYGSASLWYGDWLYEFGGQFFNASGTKCELGNQKAIDAANFVIDSSNKYGYAPTAAEAQGQDMMSWFLSGKVATYTDVAPSNIPELNSVTSIHWEVVPDPGLTPQDEIDGLAVSKSTTHSKEANLFAKYLSTSTAVQKVIGGSSASLGVPVIKSAVSSFAHTQPGHNLNAFVISANTAPFIGTPPNDSNQIINEIWTELNNQTALGTGKQAPATALPKIAQNIDQMINK